MLPYGGHMGESERRRALRVPVRGFAVLHGADGAVYGAIENLSRTGVLVTVSGVPAAQDLDVELKLGTERGRVRARTVRSEQAARRFRVAVAFDLVDDATRAAIDAAIAA